jgi:hypothetical protein
MFGGGCALRRKPLATLGTASLEDRAARSGLHPGTETVLALPAARVRLKRSLRHLDIFRSDGGLRGRVTRCTRVVANSAWPYEEPGEYSGGAFVHVKGCVVDFVALRA